MYSQVQPMHQPMYQPVYQPIYHRVANPPMMGFPGFQKGTPLSAPPEIQRQWYTPTPQGVPEIGASFGDMLGE